MGTFKYKEVVEAYQFTGDIDKPGWPEGWLPEEAGRVAEEGEKVFIRNKDGINMGQTGDYVVKNQDGSFFCVFGGGFADLYEVVAPAPGNTPAPKVAPAPAPEAE